MDISFCVNLCMIDPSGIQQMRHLGPNLTEGDVLLSNHPAAGGSHLPDLTIITPVSCCSTISLFVVENTEFVTCA